jgi:hypothetical protein
MDYTCHLCQNSNEFKSFVRIYDDSFEEIRKKSCFSDPKAFRYIHLKCASFHPELEIGISKNSVSATHFGPNDKDFSPEVFVYEGKKLFHSRIQDCAFCEYARGPFSLVPCLIKLVLPFYV